MDGNTIQLWIQITSIPFEYRVVAGAIGMVVNIDVAKAKTLIEIPCTKPLIFSSVLEFEEGLETKVMFEYARLFGFCPLCFRMTHNADLCYKAKKEITTMAVNEKKKIDVGARNRSFKGALLSGIHGGVVSAKTRFLTGPNEGSRKPRGLFQNKSKQGALKMAEIENVAEVSFSSKKVRRPLFQEDAPQEKPLDSELVAGEIVADGAVRPITKN